MSNREALDNEVRLLARRSRQLSSARMILFAILVASLFVGGPFRWIVAGASIAVFIVLIVRHERVGRKLRALEGRLQLWDERALRAQDRRHTREAPDWPDNATQLEGGARIYRAEPRSFRLDEGVVDDLQLFSGVRTVFGFLDVSSTIFGARRLRHLLERPLLDKAEIEARQRLVEELATREGQCSAILEALLPLRSRDFRSIPGFLGAEPVFAARAGVSFLAHVFGTLPIICALCAVVWGIQYLALLVVLGAINMGIVGLYQKQSNPARDRVVLFGPLLEALLRVSDQVRATDFESHEGEELQSAFVDRTPLFQGLRRRVWWLGLHAYGPVFELFNYLTLFELRVLPGTERLLRAHRGDLEAGIGALGELEAHLSLACALREQDDFRLPTILGEGAPRISGIGVAHPLLEPEIAVRNSFEIGNDVTVMLVTGSNMSGKSTFLKTVGVNVILAQVGAAVTAEEFCLTPITMHTDVNVRDSLDDGKSYFQVEVERVRQAIDAATVGEAPVLAIFDELFRGTNSEERYAISAAILRYMRDRGALMIVATHDLRLTELVTEADERGMANFHFLEHVVEDEMSFDYQLRSGPAQSRNAIRVLEVNGYPQGVIDEARGRVRES